MPDRRTGVLGQGLRGIIARVAAFADPDPATCQQTTEDFPGTSTTADHRAVVAPPTPT
ncbi:hypothetical protein [Streptomyces sp. NBC_00343]|uniref:hypothetical protein n=1 Tax=Streptomyces sp. NBC_00343 TaxID=2975719 RepID=UPI002E2A2A8C|nr:hypothetical protein [Streptomyces sp. NBC_00343]